jgi:hypothetical protein
MEISTTKELAEYLFEQSQTLRALSLELVRHSDWGSPPVRAALRVLALQSESLGILLRLGEKQAGVQSLVVTELVHPEAELREFPESAAANDPEA